jgi:hypothetical protein
MWKGFQHYTEQLKAQIYIYLMHIATDGASLNNTQETEGSSCEETEEMRKTPNYSCVVICIKPIDLQQLMVSWR